MTLKRGRNEVTSRDDILAQIHVIVTMCIILMTIASDINLFFVYSHHLQNMLKYADRRKYSCTVKCALRWDVKENNIRTLKAEENVASQSKAGSGKIGCVTP